MLKTLIVHQHMGLGDHIDCNGLVRILADQFNFVELFVKKHNYESVQRMYRDNSKIRLIVLTLDGLDDEYQQVKQYVRNRKSTPFHRYDFVQIGHKNYPKKPSPSVNCREYFYQQFDLNLEDLKQSFYYQRDLNDEVRVLEKLNPHNEPFAFVHDDPKRGFVIPDAVAKQGLKILRNDLSENIFSYLKVLEQATEIHCMESSFKSLTELFPTNGKLYFHDFRGHPLSKTFKNWNTVSYNQPYSHAY